MQRRFRAVALTVLAAAVLGGLSVAVLGTRVWSDFLFYHLPNVQSGDALRFMAGTTREIAFNVAPFGIPFKLGALGLGDWGWPEARLFGNVYTVVVTVLAILAGRNQGSARHRLTVWSAVLLLASLRSPNAPPFVLTAMLVLLLALAAEVRSTRGAFAFGAAFAVFTLPVPIADPTGQVGLSLVRALALYAFLVWAALRRDPGVDGDGGENGDARFSSRDATAPVAGDRARRNRSVSASLALAVGDTLRKWHSPSKAA